ncbi:MAG TPA: hypothetical protein VHY48_00500 [Acidobacteriaceae bacterium]|jgi:hypothetical protein|nr:hypothetical protein [Acidobacteriaceae bacterium]
MKNADEAIDKVLAGLRNAEPAPGIEHRALEAARNRQMARPPRRMTLMPALCGVALAALIVAALAVRMSHRRVPQSLTNRAPLNAVHPAAPQPLLSSARVPALRPEAQRMQRAESRPRSTSARLVAGDDPDALALREMRAPSHPAPPMPLTAQEKVLREIARAPDPQQVVLLDPVLRERQEAAANADFQRFLNSQQKGEVTNEMESQ